MKYNAEIVLKLFQNHFISHVTTALLLKPFAQVSSEVCRAFSLCRQGRSAELLTHYKSSPCPPMPAVQRDRQTSAADGNGDSSDSEPESSQV